MFSGPSRHPGVGPSPVSFSKFYVKTLSVCWLIFNVLLKPYGEFLQRLMCFSVIMYNFSVLGEMFFVPFTSRRRSCYIMYVYSKNMRNKL